MNSKMNFTKLFQNLLIALLILTTSSELFSQDKKSTDLTDFKVVIEITDNGIKLISEKGCAWKELTFSIIDKKQQAIDEYGMVELDKNHSKKTDGLADFLFTLTKTKNEIELKGIKGTAWTNLSFSLLKNQKQAVDQFGITDLK